jgi:hypothetical protein
MRFSAAWACDFSLDNLRSGAKGSSRVVCENRPKCRTTCLSVAKATASDTAKMISARTNSRSCQRSDQNLSRADDLGAIEHLRHSFLGDELMSE